MLLMCLDLISPLFWVAKRFLSASNISRPPELQMGCTCDGWKINAVYLGSLSFSKMYLFFHFWVVLGLHRCTQAVSSCGERALLFVVVLGLLIAVASLVMKHRLSSCGTWA